MTDPVTYLRAVALNLEGGAAPEWIQLIPAGAQVVGRDGRAWLNDDPQRLVDAFAANGAELPIDFEHATEIKAGKGDPAPAIGWITEMQVRDGGSVWGRAEWLDPGREAVAARRYRYVSPVFLFDPETTRIERILSAGLTNQPNLRMAALNRQNPEEEEDQMSLTVIAKALGLPENADADAIATAANRLRTEASQPPLERFVPRADYQAAMNRADAAEAELARVRDEALTAEVEAAVDAAIEAGKIAPASRAYHVAACRSEGGLAAFRAMVAAAPELVAGATPAPRKDTAVNRMDETDVELARALGMSPADYAAANNKEL